MKYYLAKILVDICQANFYLQHLQTKKSKSSKIIPLVALIGPLTSWPCWTSCKWEFGKTAFMVLISLFLLNEKICCSRSENAFLLARITGKLISQFQLRLTTLAGHHSTTVVNHSGKSAHKILMKYELYTWTIS